MTPTLQFLSLPNAPAEDADVLILPVPHEGTVSYRGGTAGAPEAILSASDQLEFYDEDAGWCPFEYMKLAVLPPFAVSCTDPADYHDQLLQAVQSLPRENLLVALGGEHSITPELVFGRMPMGGTVVQIDAHADLRSSYRGSVYSHACPMYRLHQRGYELLQIGIRSLHAREAALIATEGLITTHFDRDLRHREKWQQLLDQLAALEGDLWLTIDMDGFNPALVPSVGTPQPGGLSWHQGVDILETLISNPRIRLCGMDLVELVPDPSRVSEMMAAKLVQKGISIWGRAEGYQHREKCGSQVGVEDD